jgi:hypothetical protein
MESHHFSFRFHKQDQPYMNQVMGESEGLYEKIIQDIGSAPTKPIGVVMAFTEEEFNRFQPEGHPLPQWAVGVAYPELNLMVIRSPRLVAGNQEDPIKTFTHELSHLILATEFGGRPIPRWLNEGLAMYESYEWHPSQDLLMARAVLSGQLIPLGELIQAFGGEGFEVRQAYLESYSLVNYLISTYGRGDFHRFVRQLARGQSFEQALQETFLLSPQTFEAQWKRHLKFRFNWIPFLTSTALLWFLISFSLFGVYLIRKRKTRRILQEWKREEELEGKYNEEFTRDEESDKGGPRS